jgi:hypothetical protein
LPTTGGADADAGAASAATRRMPKASIRSRRATPRTIEIHVVARPRLGVRYAAHSGARGLLRLIAAHSASANRAAPDGLAADSLEQRFDIWQRSGLLAASARRVR